MGKGYVSPAVPAEPYELQRLRDPETAAAYLNITASDEDPAAFLQALRKVTKAMGGISRIAELAGLNRQQLYRTLSKNGNPEFRSLQKLLGATGLSINVVTAEQKRAKYKVRRKPGNRVQK